MSSDFDLFRKEAVEFSTQRLYGHVVVLPKISHGVVFLTLIAVLMLCALALFTGVHVEQRPVNGRLIIHAHQVSVDLYVPADVSGAVVVGQHLLIDPMLVSGGRRNTVMLDAVVTTVATSARLMSADKDSSSGMIYVPVALLVDEQSIRAAGIPVDDDVELPARSFVETRRESWARWLLNIFKISSRAA